MKPDEKSLQGKTILITGATAGIGRAAAGELARLGAAVVGISRNPEKCSRVAEEIRRSTGNENVGILCADLSSMAEVRAVADDILAQLARIDVLINNAGGIFLTRQTTVDGFERTYALNHLSAFLLTSLLIDRIAASRPARIINVSSSAQFRGRIHFGDLQLERGYWFMKAYGQSKQANMLFTYELDRKMDGRGITVNALHPGLVRTNIATQNSRLIRVFQRWLLRNARTPEQGARTIVYLASSPEVEGVSGKFFIDEQAVPSARQSYDVEAAARLWQISAEQVRPFTI